jgi:valyl-tRNA synthetase
MVKPRWSGENPNAADARTAKVVAHRVLDGILHLLHPIMPFISEEIWQALPHKGESLAVSPWPVVKRSWTDAGAEREMDMLMELVSAVRTMRGEMNVPPGKPVPVVARAAPETARLIVDNRDLLSPLARVETWTVGPETERPRVAASSVFRGVELWLPLEGLIDVDAERMRLAKEADRVHTEIERTKGKLMNHDFLTKAKKEVVDQQREKLALLEETVSKLKRAREAMSG